MDTKKTVRFPWDMFVCGLMLGGLATACFFIEKESYGPRPFMDSPLVVWLGIAIIGWLFVLLPLYDYVKKLGNPARDTWTMLFGLAIMFLGVLFLGFWTPNQTNLLSGLSLLWRIGIIIVGGVITYRGLRI